ncbi:MAG: hypothetical protein K8S62_00325, partial [Candidatus Sabulitectum sp.]|nr:hypothetical protein [Candidatus Sabulitectum sp.]
MLHSDGPARHKKFHDQFRSEGTQSIHQLECMIEIIISPNPSQILYCNTVYSSGYFVILMHQSSTYCKSMPPDYAFASLVTTALYGI